MSSPDVHVDAIADHVDGCTCSRCVGLERCPSCGRLKLDIDWCWAERRLVFVYLGIRPVVLRRDGEAGK